MAASKEQYLFIDVADTILHFILVQSRFEINLLGAHVYKLSHGTIIMYKMN